MQWLVDLVKESLGILPVFIDRGDPAQPDWFQPSFTSDGNWHDFDISAHVPANARVISFLIIIIASAQGDGISLKKSGNISDNNISTLTTQVAAAAITGDLLIAATPNQEIQYKITPNVTSMIMTVKGWWL